jgi:hypothetical protein
MGYSFGMERRIILNAGNEMELLCKGSLNCLKNLKEDVEDEYSTIEEAAKMFRDWAKKQEDLIGGDKGLNNLSTSDKKKIRHDINVITAHAEALLSA